MYLFTVLLSDKGLKKLSSDAILYLLCLRRPCRHKESRISQISGPLFWASQCSARSVSHRGVIVPRNCWRWSSSARSRSSLLECSNELLLFGGGILIVFRLNLLGLTSSKTCIIFDFCCLSGRSSYNNSWRFLTIERIRLFTIRNNLGTLKGSGIWKISISWEMSFCMGIHISNNIDSTIIVWSSLCSSQFWSSSLFGDWWKVDCRYENIGHFGYVLRLLQRLLLSIFGRLFICQSLSVVRWNYQVRHCAVFVVICKVLSLCLLVLLLNLRNFSFAFTKTHHRLRTCLWDARRNSPIVDFVGFFSFWSQTFLIGAIISRSGRT